MDTCECHFCTTKLRRMRENKTLPFKFYLKFLLFCLLAYVWFNQLLKTKNSSKLKGFDPFEILGVTGESTDKEIRKAYRGLARKFHPDKNKGDPDAHKAFVLVNKAFSCIENEEARKEYIEGTSEALSGNVSVGIALPPFLLQKENQMVILSLFFIILLIVLPFGAMYLYQTSDLLDGFGSKKNLFIISLEYLKNENILFRNFLELLCICEEIQPFYSVPSEQVRDLKKLVDPELKAKNKKLHQVIMKPFYLLNAYMKRKKVGPSLSKDLRQILGHCINLLNSLQSNTLELFRTPEQVIKRILEKPLKFPLV